MINKLTKNFSFIEDNKFKLKNKENIIRDIERIERLREEDINTSISDIQKILECIINDYIEKHDLNISLNDWLSDKIKAIQTDTRIEFSKYIFSIMREIKAARNFEQHKHNDKNPLPLNFNKFDVISKLRNLFVIIKYLYQEEIKEIIKDFDEFDFNPNTYIENLKIDNNISAISEKERKENDSFLNSHDLKIDQDSIRSWLSIENAKIIIPIYQRKYEWEEENITCLLEDIKSRTEDEQTHYFGTIAQKKIMSDENNKFDQIKIIDGQQRITTSLLIICACRDYLRNMKNEYLIEEMDWYNNILNKKTNQKLEEYIYNPGGTIKNNEIFRRILKGELEGLEKEKNNKFWNNYNIIIKFLEENFKKKEEIIDFVLIFLDKFIVASINFDNNKFPNKKEMELFENLNTKGKELSISDLAKNHIFNFCDDHLSNTKETEIALNWNNMISNSKICKQNDDNDLETFYDILGELNEGKELPKSKRIKFQSIKKSINYFLEEYENISTEKEYKKMLNCLESYMFIYKEISSEDVPQKFLKFLKIDKIINIISIKKKKRLFIYFAFVIYKNLKDDQERKIDYNNLDDNNFILTKEEIKNIQNMFLSICKFIIKTKIIEKQGDSEIKRGLIRIANENFGKKIKINNICENVIEGIKKLFNNDDEKYNFNKFKAKLHDNLNTTQVSDLLTLTEYCMNNSLLDEGEQITRKNREVEHIMPQSINKWIEDLNLNYQDEIKYRENWNNCINKIGNYLLLTSGQNKKVNDNTFLTKKEKAYKNLCSPLYINDIYNDIDVSKKTEWTFNDIEKRSHALIKYITENVITEKD